MKESVKLLHVAENGRVMKVSVQGKGFTTPTRAVTHRELEKFRNLVTNHIDRSKFSSINPPPCEIQETVLDFNDSGVRELVSRNETLGERAYAISSKNKNGNDRVKICNIQLRSQKEPVPIEAIKLMTIMQINSDSLDMVTVPDPSYEHSSTDKLLDAIKKARKTLDDFGRDQTAILPHLDLASQPDALDKRLKALMDLGCNSIAFRYRSYAYASMIKIAEVLSTSDVWTHLSGVQKALPASPILPQIHIMPFFSFDSISSYKYPQGGRARTKPDEVFPIVPERRDPGGGRGGTTRSHDGQIIVPIEDVGRRLEKETRFDSSALGFLTKQQHRSLVGESLNCDCFLCRGLNLDQFYDEYGMNNGEPAKMKLRLHQGVHEVYASHSEFQLVQARLREVSYVDYLWEKPVILKYPTSIPEINGQSHLDTFF